MSDAAVKKYDESKKVEAGLSEREVRLEKERIFAHHNARRDRYEAYLKMREETRRLRWWQKLFLAGMAGSFLFCTIMLLCSFHPTGKIWVHELLFRILSTPAI